MTGWAFVAAYLVLAGVLFHQALTCTGWVCDLVALPALFPLGFPIAWVVDWVDSFFLLPRYITRSLLRNWIFIIPTVFANALFYYWLGLQVEKVVSRMSQRFTK